MRRLSRTSGMITCEARTTGPLHSSMNRACYQQDWRTNVVSTYARECSRQRSSGSSRCEGTCSCRKGRLASTTCSADSAQRLCRRSMRSHSQSRTPGRSTHKCACPTERSTAGTRPAVAGRCRQSSGFSARMRSCGNRQRCTAQW